jgi:S1-C subfamily serine protease
MRVKFWVGLALLPLFAVPASAAELPELAERTKTAVVLLTVEDSVGNDLGTGTGFFASPDGRIITNEHVIKNGAKITATLSDGSKRAVLGLLALDEQKDIAILQVDGGAVPALTLGDSSRVKPGDEVVVIGSPMGLSGTLTVGIVSAIREHGANREGIQDPEMVRAWGIQITAAISPGSSGSPVMTRSGEVIAVAVGVFNGAQSLNFGVPIEVAKALLNGLGPNPKITPFESTSRHGVRRNLIISAALFGMLVVAYFLWNYLERRGSNAPRPRKAVR